MNRREVCQHIDELERREKEGDEFAAMTLKVMGLLICGFPKATDDDDDGLRMAA